MVELTFEKLYLAKDSKDNKQDIYIDKCPLIQHQLDGIRFLYRALAKKKRGVILNDPSGYGKRVQTALFLSAILPTLDKPVLILCREGKEQQWIKHFQEWTQVSDNVAIELLNPFVKMKVLISACYAAAAFARRDWSILVVDDDHISKDMQKSSLKADLRIWITSSDIRDDLSGKFSSFYSWTYPKAKFPADKYKANKSDLRDVLMKTAMLDAFLEDTVLRRMFGVTPFLTNQVKDSNTNIEARITKKNKDATGKKIKRSKRKSIDADDTENTEVTPNKVVKHKNTIENTEVFEISIDDQEPKVKTNIVTRDVDINTQNDEDNFPMKPRDKGKKTMVLQDSEGSEDDMSVHRNQDHSNIYSQLDESDEQSKVLRWDSDTDSGNGHINTTMKSDLNCDDTELKDENDVKDNPETIDNLVNSKNQFEMLHENYIDNEVTDKVKSNQFSEDLFSTDFTTKPNEINVSEKTKDPLTNLNYLKDIETRNAGTDIIKQDKVNEKTDQNLEENANLSVFELKLKQLEERMLKKYKGSFLDSIL